VFSRERQLHELIENVVLAIQWNSHAGIGNYDIHTIGILLDFYAY
jgi:hypothetical protein